MSISANVHHGESMGRNSNFVSRCHSYGMLHIVRKVFLRQVTLQQKWLDVSTGNFWCLNSGEFLPFLTQLTKNMSTVTSCPLLSSSGDDTVSKINSGVHSIHWMKIPFDSKYNSPDFAFTALMTTCLIAGVPLQGESAIAKWSQLKWTFAAPYCTRRLNSG